MIAFITGTLVAIEDDSLIIDIGSIGLSVAAPLSMLDPRPVIGASIYLHTHLQVREDAWTLYGFSSKEQLHIFRMLLNVSGVGAKTALCIVDAINAARFKSILASREIKPLTAISGIGKKTAERIMLELKDKFETIADDPASMTVGEEYAFAADSVDRDLLAALKQLGYSATEARSFALAAQADSEPDARSEELLKKALQIAMRS